MAEQQQTHDDQNRGAALMLFYPLFGYAACGNQASSHATISSAAFRSSGLSMMLPGTWYPLGHGDASLLSNPTIQALADKYGKNAGQIILRFEVQDGVITLPKSTNPERIRTNLDIFDFELTGDEMNKIRAMDTGKGSHDPDAPGVEQMLRGAFVIED